MEEEIDVKQIHGDEPRRVHISLLHALRLARINTHTGDLIDALSSTCLRCVRYWQPRVR